MIGSMDTHRYIHGHEVAPGGSHFLVFLPLCVDARSVTDATVGLSIYLTGLIE